MHIERALGLELPLQPRVVDGLGIAPAVASRQIVERSLRNGVRSVHVVQRPAPVVDALA